MQILYVAKQYDYGDPSRGMSFEHYNFYESLLAMGSNISYFDYPTMVEDLGRAKANRRLEEIVRRDKPDILFGVINHDSIDKRVIRRITQETDTVTINWFCDDHWQFEKVGRAWAPQFNYVVTTSQIALANYKKYGFKNVIKSQWGANHALYKPSPGMPRYDVSFVGQPYGMRRDAIETLRRAGVRVHTWGQGWPTGKLDQDQMIQLFSSSRINLNFADASSSGHTCLETLATSHTIQTMRNKPVLWRVWSLTQHAIRWDNKRRTERSTLPPPRQIKGRTFEVPSCGGFLLTQPAEDLTEYLRPGVECATFDTADDLVEQVRYYLANEDERHAISECGYQRTLSDHTYEERFRAIFKQAGLTGSNALKTAA